MNSRDSDEEDKPEPEENIDLLIDDVEREDTETVFILNGSRWTILVKGT